MVLTMVLHLLAISPSTSPRLPLFSWVSGVVVLWLVYASGINGTCCLDQLRAVHRHRDAEWFDALPVFNGLLMRNFLSPDSVNDRFFSLLSFLHIGLPLASSPCCGSTRTACQREDAAAAPLMAALGVAMCALGGQPALSQAPANLATIASRIDFDWFYLPTYALSTVEPGAVWALVAASLSSRPSRPGCRRSSAAAIRASTCSRTGQPHRAREGRRDDPGRVPARGLPMPFDCRNGGCGMCKCTVLHGEVELGACQESALTARREAGRVLACVAKPLSDVEIEYEPTAESARPVRVHEARVIAMDRLAET